MMIKVNLSTTFDCLLERAFKTPFLCDIAKVHTGFLFIPRVEYTTDDHNWGKIGSSKKVYVAKSLTQKGGFMSMDRIMERKENKYWKIQVDSFQGFMLGFHKFVGEWRTEELSENKILVEYTYTIYSNNLLLYPTQYLFVHLIWKRYMKQVIENIRHMVHINEPYQYE